MNIDTLKKMMENEQLSEDYINLCVTYARSLEDKGLPIIFDSIHLAKLIGIGTKELYSYYELAQTLYSTAVIPKKTGGSRKLNAPSENLKYIQKWIVENVLYRLDTSKVATGFVPQKSIVDNAKPHVGKECVINLDLKDFFPSIKYVWIYNLFISLGYTRHLSMLFTGICTLNNELPQGAPSSPYLSNLICEKLDSRLSSLAENMGASYTRYADDLTFSGDKEITKYIKLIKRVIKEEKFELNEKKVRVRFSYHQQMVTGLIVNEKLSVPQKTKKYLRQQIYYAKKYGVSSSLQKQGVTKSNYNGHLFGLAYFIKMVEPDCGTKFIEELKQIDWET
ncbi:retron St85 family RNA-directed DNA polymerase [Rossellomorea arthrocnemi]|uniref:retron St85 family RNA-directed DNA polymerase n=1 Tax=Rossellomorea arthrocnemi TaxID=2769542 RepID=UPI0019185DFF|nr:retron St85 family RNA-directed DNA polymerase [Rossellomorea arthrocnemi]